MKVQEETFQDITVDHGETTLQTFGLGFLVPFYHHVFGNPFRERVDKFMADTVKAVNDLETESRVTREQLCENKLLLDTFIQAGKIAAETSDEKKKEMLLNAVKNVALEKTTDKMWTKVLLSFAGNFDYPHFQFLQFFQEFQSIPSDDQNDARLFGKDYYHSAKIALFEHFGPIYNDGPLIDIVIHQLFSEKFVQNKQPIVTPLGDKMLDFFSEN